MMIIKQTVTRRNRLRLIFFAFILALTGTETALAADGEAQAPDGSSGDQESPAAQAESTVADEAAAVDMSAFDVEDGTSLLGEAVQFATDEQNIEVDESGKQDRPDLLTVDSDTLPIEDARILAEGVEIAYDLNLLDNPKLVGTMSENAPRP